MEQLGAPPDCIPDVYAFSTRMQLNTLGQMSRQELMVAQGQDSLIGPTIHAVKCGKWSDDVKSSPEMLPMKREMGKLVMRNPPSHAGEKTHQLVLPAEFRAVVLKSMRDNLGHLGV